MGGHGGAKGGRATAVAFDVEVCTSGRATAVAFDVEVVTSWRATAVAFVGLRRWSGWFGVGLIIFDVGLVGPPKQAAAG